MKMKAFIQILAALLLFVLLLSSNKYIHKTRIKEQGFEIDTSHSAVKWFCTQHNGKIKVKKGYIEFKGDSLTKMSITLDMNTITNDDIPNELLKGTLENVLKSPDFFDVKSYPESYFDLYSYEKSQGNTYILTGDVHLLKNDICSTFPIEIAQNKDSIYIKSKPIILNRTHWGIYYLSRNNLNPKEGDETFIVSDSIEITLDIKGFKKKV